MGFYKSEIQFFPEAVNLFEIHLFLRYDRKIMTSNNYEIYLNEDFQQYILKNIFMRYTIPM